MASISGAFEPSRRRDDLTWSHHVAVAALPEEEQERWLDRAAAEGLSVADLRTELRAAPKQGRQALPAEGIEEGEASSEEVESLEREPEVLCPQCGYRLGSG
jgi:hypothetical protein